jgi:hypothetical protein
MNIEQAIRAKRELEVAILKAIGDYERATRLTVREVQLTHAREIGTSQKFVVDARVQVLL